MTFLFWKVDVDKICNTADLTVSPSTMGRVRRRHACLTYLCICLQVASHQAAAFVVHCEPTRTRRSWLVVRTAHQDDGDSSLDDTNIDAPTASNFDLSQTLSEIEESERMGELSAAKLVVTAQDEDEHTNISKAKWKKKKYLLTNDVTTMIAQNHPKAVAKAQEMIHRMWTLAEKTSDPHFQPDAAAYNLWIHALAKSRQTSTDVAGAATMAEQVLQEMTDKGIKPTVISYSAVMDAYAQHSRRDPAAASAAERVFFNLLQAAELDKTMKVTAVTCDIVLNAWARQGTANGARKAQEILERLEILGAGSFRPTAFSYATVCSGWAQLKSTQGAVQAQAVLDNLVAQCEKDNSRKNDIDSVVFNSCIHAWATSGDAAAGSKAVALLKQMQELSTRKKLKKYQCAPDTVSFNTVLSAWSHSSHVNAAAQAERVLQEMVTAHRETDSAPAPNTISYNSVLHAWSKSLLPGAAARAQAVLNFMILSKQSDIAPDVFSFTSVLDALAKSKEPGKAVQASQLLEKLLEMYTETNDDSLRPSQVTFNTVLNGCAFSALGTTEQEQRDALKIAVRTFTRMRKEQVLPDTVSYGNLIKCFANLMPQGKARNDMALQVLEKCMGEGLVGELVWNEIRRAVPNKLLGEKMVLSKPVGSIRVQDLPSNCRRNVCGDKKARPRRQTTESKKAKKEAPARKAKPIRQFRNFSEASYQSGRDV